MSALHSSVQVLAGNDRVKVDTFDGLLVDYVLSQEATVIIRGLQGSLRF